MQAVVNRGTRADVVFLQPPSPPLRNLLRDYAGGFGVAQESVRATWGHDVVTQPSLSLVYAFSAVRKVCSATFVDAEAEQLDREALLARIREIAPRIIVAIVNLPSLETDLTVLSALKDACGAVIVAAGTVCRAIPQDVLAGGVADVAVSGDVEVVAVSVVERLLARRSLAGIPGVTLKDGDSIVVSPGGSLEDLSALPVPAFDQLRLDRYRTSEFGLRRHVAGKQWGGYPTYFPLYLSRGCSYGCPYCPYPLGFGHRWRSKPVDQVAEEFAAASACGIHHVLMRDQTIAEDPDYLSRVCDMLIASGSGIRWMAEARLDSLDAPMLRHMHAAGCVRLHYGVETGDPALFDSYAKRGVGFANITKTLRETAEAGILPAAHFLIGFPDDNWATIRRTAEFIGEAGIAFGDCAIMTPYPGTPFYARMAEEGRIVGNGWSRFTGCDPVLRLDHLSPLELSLGRWSVLQALRDNKRPTLRRRLRAAFEALSSRSPGETGQLRRFIESAALAEPDAELPRPTAPGLRADRTPQNLRGPETPVMTPGRRAG